MSEPDEEVRENGKEIGGGYKANFKKVKRVVLFRLAKLRRRLLSGKKSHRAGGRFGGGCLCSRGESSFRSNTSDPNDPSFTYEMLKAVIEQNDFYSRECNPHLYNKCE